MNHSLTVTKGRFDYIDITKALGMLTIIWGHIAVGKSVTFAYSFHIPLFFFLSGMVFVKGKYPTIGSFVKRRIQTLIVPYIIYSFITWAVWAAFSYATHAKVASYWMPLCETFIAQGSEGYLVHNVPLWFVSCLFVVELVYYWIAKLPDIWNVVACMVMAVVGYVIVNDCSFFDFTTLPWSIEVAMSAILFYASGHLLVKNVGHQQITHMVDSNKLGTAVLFLLVLVLAYLGAITNGKVSMGHAILRNPFLFYPTAYLGVGAMLLFSLLLAQSKLNEKKWMGGVKWFGQNSFIPMVIHNPIKGFVVVAVSSCLGVQVKEAKQDFLMSAIAFVTTLLVTVVLMYIIVKVKAQLKKKHECSNI